MKTKLFFVVALCMAATMAFAQQSGSKGGRFTVASGVQVRFAQGNLQYHVRNKVWQFATRQDSVIGKPNENRIEENYDGWIDLFGWGTSGYNNKMPYMHSNSNTEYAFGNNTSIAGTNYDWGVYCVISNGGNKAGLWRTLTEAEWMYLFNNRTDARKLHGFGSVNGRRGFILLPDGWALPAGGHFTHVCADRSQNVYTSDDWAIMEAAGAIFLPDAGYAAPNSKGIVNWSGPSESGKGKIGEMVSYYMSSTAKGASSYAAFRLEYGLSSYDSENNLVKSSNTRNFLNENPVRLAYTIVDYDVVFKNWDGTVLASQPVEVGSSATPPTPPDRAGYTFTGWSSSVTGMTPDLITGPVTFTALYEERVTYIVKFIDTYDGSTLKTESVDPNGAATAPTIPTHTGYTFLQWDKSFSNVTGNIEVRTQYKYSVRIAGTYITDLNLTILGTLTGVAVASGGFFSFDPSTRTLKMKDVTITTDNVTQAIFNQLPNLTIEVEGTCDLNTPYCIALRIDQSTTIIGKDNNALLKARNAGPLPSGVEGGTAGMCYAAATTFNNSNLTISNCKIAIEGAGGVFIQGSSQLTLNRVELTSKVIGTPSSSKQEEVMYSFRANVEPLLNNCELLAPEGINYSSTLKGYTADGNSLTRDEVKIGQAPCTPKTNEFSDVACNSYTWNGETYTTSGDYQQTLTAVSGCDSVVTLHLTINQSKTGEFSQTAEGSYKWNDQTYMTSGDYVQTLTADNGCDSVVTLHLTITQPAQPSKSITWRADDADIKDLGTINQNTTVRGLTFVATPNRAIVIRPKTQTYESSLTFTHYIQLGGTMGEELGESYRQLKFDVEGNTKIEIYAYTASNSAERPLNIASGTWDNTINSVTLIGQAGITHVTYNYTGAATTLFIGSGNQGINVLGIKISGDWISENTCVAKTSEFSLTAESAYTWNTQTYIKSGDYQQVFQTVDGCDSIVTLHLTITQPTTQLYYVAGNGRDGNPWCDELFWKADGSLLQNGSITFRDVPAGSYEFKVTAGAWNSCGNGEWGFGTVSKLCSSENVFNGGVDECGNVKLLTSITQDITINFDGDSICVLGKFDDPSIVTVTEYTVVGAAELLGESWDLNASENNMTEIDPGVYRLKKQFIVLEAGKDYQYKVVGNHDYAAYQIPNAMENNILTVAQNGEYHVTFILDRNANPNTLTHEVIASSAAICSDKYYEFWETTDYSYEWNGEIYTKSGIYTQTIPMAGGCDSIVTLHLTISTPCSTSFNSIEEVVLGTSYEIGGETFTESGYYEIYLKDVNGCDSIITLFLHLFNPETMEERSVWWMVDEYNTLGLGSGEESLFPYKVRGYVSEWNKGYPDFQYADFYISSDKEGSEPTIRCYQLKADNQDDKQELMEGDLIEAIAHLKNSQGNILLANGTFHVVEHNDQGIENIDADVSYEKLLIDGMLYILRGEKIYTVEGQVIK